MKIKIVLEYASYAAGARYNGSSAKLVGIVNGVRYENKAIPGIKVLRHECCDYSVPRRYVSYEEILEVEVPEDFSGELYKEAISISGTGNRDSQSRQKLFPVE